VTRGYLGDDEEEDEFLDNSPKVSQNEQQQFLQQEIRIFYRHVKIYERFSHHFNSTLFPNRSSCIRLLVSIITCLQQAQKCFEIASSSIEYRSWVVGASQR